MRDADKLTVYSSESWYPLLHEHDRDIVADGVKVPAVLANEPAAGMGSVTFSLPARLTSCPA